MAHPTFNSRHIWISHSYTQQVQLHEWDAWTHVSKRQKLHTWLVNSELEHPDMGRGSPLDTYH